MNDDQLRKFVQRVDHIQNEMSDLGSLKDASQRDEIFDPRELNEAELQVLYDHNSYVRRVIDKPSTEAIQRGWQVKTSDTIDRSGFRSDERSHSIKAKVRRADKWAHLYGGAALILVTQDDKDNPKKPLNLDRVDQLLGMRLKSKYDVTPGPIQTDPEKGLIGEPEYFKVAVNFETQLSAQGGPQVREFSTRVHRSRVIPFFGPESADDDCYWGQSKVQLVWNALSNLWQAENALANHIHTWSRNIFRMKGLREHIMSGGEEALEELQNSITAMQIAAAQLGAWLIDADSESFEKQTTDIGKLGEGYDRLVQSFAAAADFPITKLFGTPPAGMTSDDKSAQRNWSNRMRGKQQETYEPALDRIYTVLTASRAGPTGGQVPEGLYVSVNPSDEPTESEKISNEKTRSEAVANLIDRAVFTAQEAREGIYSDPEKNDLIVIDKQSQGDAIRTDPYSGPNDPELIEDFPAVADLSTQEVRQWLAVFEDIINSEESNIGEAAAAAFAAVRDDATDFPTTGEDRPVGFRASQFEMPNIEFVARIREYSDAWGPEGDRMDTIWADLLEVRVEHNGVPQTDEHRQLVRRREQWAAQNSRADGPEDVIEQLQWHVLDERGYEFVADTLRQTVEGQVDLS